MGIRRVHTDKLVLEHAIIEGIDTFVRGILVPRNWLRVDRYEAEPAFESRKRAVARETAAVREHMQVSCPPAPQPTRPGCNIGSPSSSSGAGELTSEGNARRVQWNWEIIQTAVIDGFNTFVRDVLVPDGLVNGDSYYGDDSLTRLAYEIAAKVASQWECVEPIDRATGMQSDRSGS